MRQLFLSKFYLILSILAKNWRLAPHFLIHVFIIVNDSFCISKFPELSLPFPPQPTNLFPYTVPDTREHLRPANKNKLTDGVTSSAVRTTYCEARIIRMDKKISLNAYNEKIVYEEVTSLKCEIEKAILIR